MPRVRCDHAQTQMGLEYVAQGEPEGTEVICLKKRTRGMLLLPSTTSLEGIEKTKPGLSEACSKD